MSFAPWIEIDTQALQHNLEVVRSRAPDSRVMAVIKANAYGHGVLQVAKALDAADAFAVARVDEAVALRAADISKPLLVLAGAHSPHELQQASQLGVQLVVHHDGQLQLLKNTRLASPVTVWLKLDTGMNRLGFPPSQADQLSRELRALPNVSGVAAVLTHLANADDLEDNFTRQQLEIFFDSSDGLELERSIANSAGILGWTDSHVEWVRPGIMLYGASPFSTPVRDLLPVMTFASRLISVKTIPAGVAVGYGGIWKSPQTMPVGVAAVGYGDGYPREMPSGTPVLLNGQSVPVVGRVSMDTLMIDLRQQPQARVGDEVILWGQGLPAETIAAAANTIPYTLFCGITGRVTRRIS
jgi:alanine racemase